VSGKKSLYDLLEVSTTASVEAIRSSFDRLTAKFEEGSLVTHAGLDAQAHYNLIKDAYFTLGNPNKRADYDKKINTNTAASTPATTYYEDSPGMSSWTKVFLVVLVVAAGIYGYKIHRDSEVETARLLAQAQQAELEKTQKEKDMEALALSSQQTAQERAEMERARIEADQNSHQLQRNQEQARRDEERTRQEEERRRQSDARQQQYRGELERQRTIAASQRQDYSRPKSANIEYKPEKLSPNR
jgi:curved DNA-binding protein CbpA